MRLKRQTVRVSDVPTSDVLKHLADSLQVQWRRYRKRLKRCQRRFSEEAVHDSRVETRRLLATVELLRAFIPEKEIKKARRDLKGHLDTFDQVRDTQVQLAYVGRMKRAFPLAKAFGDWLARRETRFTRKTRRAIKHVKTKRLACRIDAFGKEIKALRWRMTRQRAFKMALRAIDQAFVCVAESCRRVKADDSATIHRTRIAFKRFRYMVEAMSPLLPSITEEHGRAMHGYQSMMGDIQDAEVLLSAMGKFIQAESVDGRSARKLREELRRRRRWLIQVYMNAADKLGRFWPLPGCGKPNRQKKQKKG